MVQGREALYTHEHGYDSDCLSPLQQRKHHSQWDDLQLQAALLVQGLRQKFSRGSPTQRLHRRKARGDPARLPGEIQSARAFAYLRCLAQYRDELARKKSKALPELSETLAKPDPEDQEATTLELDELWSFVLKKAQKRWVWLALCAARRARWSPTTSATGAKRVAASCGSGCRRLIAAGTATPTSGRR